ncbi:unnamed protein product [Aureobasidium vineae]|uniref:F-box domain-containing protein n=1 Tax=Aureobasidium vineae TaxID=2773715 RepID=A0A9N8PC49_9PEZI|nr:unnamed protein product [Aureobasidium vineae]
MGQLDSFPRELLYLTLEYCNLEDCKNLRATCKYISGLTNERVFETYHIAFFRSHLERFVELSSNPVIARCIKRLVFVGDILPNIEDVDEFKKLIDMREPWSTFSKRYIEDRITMDPTRMETRSSSDEEYDYRIRVLAERQDLRLAALKEYNSIHKHTLNHDRLSYHFDQYARYRHEQENWGSDDSFREALSRLPNLTVAENTKHGFADNHLRFPWNRMKKDILLTPDQWMHLSAVEVDDEEGHRVVDLERGPIYMKHVDCLLAGIGRRAASPHVSPIRTLRLVNIGGQPLLDMSAQYTLPGTPDSEQSAPHMRDELPQETISNKLQGLSHLERLELDTKFETATPWQTKQLFQEIHAILSAAAHSLKTLRLECRDDDYAWAVVEEPTEDDTIAHLKIPILPQLESLRISVNATDESLVELLRAQSKTLHCLEIVDCNLVVGTWNSVLRQIPEIFDTGLQRIYLEGLHDEDYSLESGDEALFEDGLDVGEGAHPHDRAILKYLLHGGEMPELDFNTWYERNRELADRGITEWEDELLDSEVP